MNTSDVILNFLNENGNPNVNVRLNDNKNGTITINLEGIASKDFPKPSDFEDYIKSTARRQSKKNQPPLIPRQMKVIMHIIAVIVLSTIVSIITQANIYGLFNTGPITILGSVIAYSSFFIASALLPGLISLIKKLTTGQWWRHMWHFTWGIYLSILFMTLIGSFLQN